MAFSYDSGYPVDRLFRSSLATTKAKISPSAKGKSRPGVGMRRASVQRSKRKRIPANPVGLLGDKQP